MPKNGVYIKLEMQRLGQGANGKTKGAMEGAFHFRFAAPFIYHMAAKVKLDCYLDMCTPLLSRLRGFRARTIAVVPLFADDRYSRVDQTQPVCWGLEIFGRPNHFSRKRKRFRKRKRRSC